MVNHPERARALTPSRPAHDGKNSKKAGKQTPKQEPETLPLTPGLLTPSSAPVTPGLLIPGSTSLLRSSSATGSTSAGDMSRNQGGKALAGQEMKQEATFAKAAASTLSLDSLLISDAKSIASPPGLPEPHAYTMAAQDSLVISDAKSSASPPGLPGLHGYTMAAQRKQTLPTSAPPKSPNIEVRSSSVSTPRLAEHHDGDDDKDLMMLAERLMGMLDDESILRVAYELQSQGHLQEFTSELPTLLEQQQLPSVMPHQIPFVSQLNYQQLPRTPLEQHWEQQLQQTFSLDIQDSQPRVDSSPQGPQPGSDSRTLQTPPEKFVQQMLHSNNVLSKLTSPGARSPQLQLNRMVEEPEPMPASPRLEDQADSIQEALTPELSQPQDKTLQNNTKMSSLLIQNLPRSFSQKATREWVDSQGYRDLYDMLMWFPAKQSSKSSESRAFINFRNPDHAKRFRREFQHSQMSSPGQGTTQLSITSAREQGFTANFIRFWHLTQNQDQEAKHSSTTVCPFFARDMVATVSPEDKKLAEANISQRVREKKPVVKQGKPEWNATTLAVRNLPEDVSTQKRAISWLVQNGHEDFDFLLFVPRKQNHRAAKGHTPSCGLAYLFVNFTTPEKAHACTRSLHNSHVAQGAPHLSVVEARIQGYQACRAHFKELAQSGRLVPWFDAAQEKSMGGRQADSGEEDEEDEPKAAGNETLAADASSEAGTRSTGHLFQ